MKIETFSYKNFRLFSDNNAFSYEFSMNNIKMFTSVLNRILNSKLTCVSLHLIDNQISLDLCYSADMALYILTDSSHKNSLKIINTVIKEY